MKLLDRFILRITQDADEAWQDGFRTASDEADETIADKDDFISEQSEIITELMRVVERAHAWPFVSEILLEKLRGYV